jgi:2-polyprenyl-3-methyl-5-hydroxy-6-metoxy-1,4-benzoquinol methylase
MNNSTYGQNSKRPCAICNSTRSRLLYRQTFSQLSDNSGLLSGYNVVVCLDCGFCFGDDIPEQAVFNAYYRDMSKYEKIEYTKKDSPYDQARFKAMANVILKYLDNPKVRIFEVGCANGQLLSLLKNQGYKNVAGIDPSPVSAKIARLHYGINVSANTLSDVATSDETVDFLILAGVLEHVRDLNPALQKLRAMLSVGGCIFITVPDASRYAEGEDAPFQEFSVEHINFFSAHSLANLLNANGFSEVSIQEDMIISNYRTSTPVIHGLFSKEDFFSSKPSNFKDSKTEMGLTIYINQSVQGDHNIQATIEKVVKSGRPIAVWGTGAHTLRLLATSKLGEARIRAFVDSNPKYQGKTLNNIPIISPQELKELPDPILISSRVYQKEIAGQIRNELKLNNEIIQLY